MSTKKVNKPEDWKVRLVEEREDLLKRTIALKNAFDNPEFKVNSTEWEMLRSQLCAMREYLQILTNRCKYYNLIDFADMGMLY